MRGPAAHFCCISVSVASPAAHTAPHTIHSPSLVSGKRDATSEPPNMTRPEAVTWESTKAAEQASQFRPSSLTAHLPSAGDLQNEPIQASEKIRSQALTMGVCGGMSHSALIAYNYRALNAPEAMAATFECQVNTSKQASCLPPAMWHNGTMSDVFQDQRKLAARSKSSLELCSMLCNTPPMIIDEIAQREHEHAILEDYRGTPHNIVLDSLCPQIAPHIVITPALEQWDAEYIAQNNRAGPQFMPHLTVPPFFRSTCRMHTYEEFVDMFYPQPMYELYPVSQELCDETLPVVCADSPSDASQVEPQISSSYPPQRKEFEVPLGEVHWAEFMQELARILTRRARQLVAIEASLRACAFRNRYDNPGFVDSIQRPYEWIDPAKAIFADYTHRSPRTSFFIESDVPFAAPHIIIHLASADDPALFSAYPSSLQDQFLLTVPLHYESSRSHYGYSSEVEDEHYLSEGSSDIESSGPRTPSNLQRVGSGFFSGFSDGADENVVSTGRGYKAYQVVDQSKVHDEVTDSEEDEPTTSFSSHMDNGPSKFFISYDDDWDTDSLPDMDTDEWFIQDRARSPIRAAF